MNIGYHLSSEEHAPADLVNHARLAEDAGFDFALVSDHFHPWIGAQGHSPFVWSVLGGIASQTHRLRVGTAVTAPIIRTHPAIVAQAAATVATMMPGRFMLGLGTGENLNEHIFGDPWPQPKKRREMLIEAIEVIRSLWRGEPMNHTGRYYRVEDAQIFDIPGQPPPILVAASGEKSAHLAGEHGDGLINTAPDRELLNIFKDAGGRDKPSFVKVGMCYSEDVEKARKTVHTIWPTNAVPGRLMPEMRSPKDFEAVTELIDVEAATQDILCGPDPEPVIAKIRSCVEAGYDHVFVHQIGPDQEGFFRFFERDVLPALSEMRGRQR